MICSICKTETPHLTLKAIWIKESQLWVCDDCLTEAVIDYTENIEQAEKNWCYGCAQYVGGTCKASLTPNTCY